MITLIAAVAKNGVIGQSGNLPWSIPEDLKHFKELTLGHPVLMGRKTWESIPERFRPLSGRQNIVITRQTDFFLPQGVERFASLDDALTPHTNDDLFVIGGAEIYRLAMPRADRLEITHVHREVAGDVTFPEIDATAWHEVKRENHDGFAFVTYERTDLLDQHTK